MNASDMSKNPIGSKIPALLVFILAALPGYAGVEQAGIGPKAIESFGLERPVQPPESETAKLSLGDFKKTLAGINIKTDLLKPAADGRVQLFSVSRLSEIDLRNPFEVRVQVAVDVIETTFEIGGIIESEIGPGKNTVILLTKPPKVRAAGSEQPKQNEKEDEKPISRVYSVGDIVEGFHIHAIGRQSIIVEQSERFVEVSRGRPVVLCVPLSAQ